MNVEHDEGCICVIFFLDWFVDLVKEHHFKLCKLNFVDSNIT
jgi:hypothetical protein